MSVHTHTHSYFPEIFCNIDHLDTFRMAECVLAGQEVGTRKARDEVNETKQKEGERKSTGASHCQSLIKQYKFPSIHLIISKHFRDN